MFLFARQTLARYRQSRETLTLRPSLLSFLGLLLLSLSYAPLIAKPLHLGGGLGLNGNYFNQDYFATMAVALGNGAIREEVARLDAKEQEVKDIYAPGTPPANENPSQLEGGCPDIDAIIKENIAIDDADAAGDGAGDAGASTNPTVTRQHISVNGRGCAVSSSSGDSIGLLALELDFVAQYDYLPWLFFRAGLTVGIPFPISYSVGLQYTGETANQEINVTGLSDGTDAIPAIDVGVFANSKAKVSYYGYHIQIPFLVGMNLYSDKDSSFYWAMGITASFSAFFREVTANQEISIEISRNETKPLNNESYEKVVNVDRVNTLSLGTLGLMKVMGARRRIQDNLFFYVEFRWLTAGSTKVQTKGTKKEAGKSYANETAAAILLDTVFPGSVAKALNSSGDAQGGRTSNGLDLSYDMRILIGLTYTFDY